MAYAVLLRQAESDGSDASHWFPDFQTGDTQTRRSILTAAPADPDQWELVGVDRTEYDRIEALVYQPMRDQRATVQAGKDAAYDKAVAKLEKVLKNAPDAVTDAEWRELKQRRLSLAD